MKKKLKNLFYLIMAIALINNLYSTNYNFDDTINQHIKNSIKSKASSSEYIVTLSEKKTLTIFNLKTKTTYSIKKANSISNFILIDNILIVSFDNTIEIINLKTKEALDSFTLSDEIKSIALSQNNILIAASLCGEIKKYNLKTKKSEVVFNYPVCFLDWNSIKKIKISEDGSLIYFYTDNNEISVIYLDKKDFKLEDIDTYQKEKEMPKVQFCSIKVKTSNIKSIKLSPDNENLAVIHNNKYLKIINLKNSTAISEEFDYNIDKIKFYDKNILLTKHKNFIRALNLKNNVVKGYTLKSKDLMFSKNKRFLIEVNSENINIVDLYNFRYIQEINKNINLKQRLLLPYFIS